MLIHILYKVKILPEKSILIFQLQHSETNYSDLFLFIYYNMFSDLFFTIESDCDRILQLFIRFSL